MHLSRHTLLLWELPSQGQAGWGSGHHRSCGCPCSLQGTWIGWPSRLPSKSNDPMILSFCFTACKQSRHPGGHKQQLLPCSFPSLSPLLFFYLRHLWQQLPTKQLAGCLLPCRAAAWGRPHAGSDPGSSNGFGIWRDARTET